MKQMELSPEIYAETYTYRYIISQNGYHYAVFFNWNPYPEVDHTDNLPFGTVIVRLDCHEGHKAWLKTDRNRAPDYGWWNRLPSDVADLMGVMAYPFLPETDIWQ